MLYAILILALAMLATWLWGKWLWRELRDGLTRFEEYLHVRRGGITPRFLLHHLRTNMAGGNVFIAVSPRARALFRATVEQTGSSAPTSGFTVLLAVGLDPDHAQIRLIAASNDNRGIDEVVLEFDAIRNLEPIANAGDPLLQDAPDEALRLEAEQDGHLRRFHLPVESAWGLSARDLESRLERMIHQRQSVSAGPVFLH